MLEEDYTECLKCGETWLESNHEHDPFWVIRLRKDCPELFPTHKCKNEEVKKDVPETE